MTSNKTALKILVTDNRSMCGVYSRCLFLIDKINKQLVVEISTEDTGKSTCLRFITRMQIAAVLKQSANRYNSHMFESSKIWGE